MAITTKYIKLYAEGALNEEQEDVFYKSLLAIANLVIVRHFNNLSEEDRHDARSEAITGALVALKKDFVDFQQYDALHFTYTSMRHSIHNYFRKFRDKEIAIDPDLFNCGVDDNANSGMIFENLLHQMEFLYSIEIKKYVKSHPEAIDLVVPFDKAILRMDILDSILLHKAFNSVREDSHANLSPVKDMFEQHRV